MGEILRTRFKRGPGIILSLGAACRWRCLGGTTFRLLCSGRSSDMTLLQLRFSENESSKFMMDVTQDLRERHVQGFVRDVCAFCKEYFRESLRKQLFSVRRHTLPNHQEPSMPIFARSLAWQHLEFASARRSQSPNPALNEPMNAGLFSQKFCNRVLLPIVCPYTP